MSCIGLSITHSYASDTVQVVSEVVQVLLFKNINFSTERKKEKKNKSIVLFFIIHEFLTLNVCTKLKFKINIC